VRTSCSEIQEALSLLVAGELPEGEAKEVWVHLEGCAPCARLRSGFMRQDELIRAASVPALGTDELRFMALRARSRSAGAARENATWRVLAAAAVLLALLIPTVAYVTFAPCKDGPQGLDGVVTTFDVDF
jgi:anti-sigma factor RsiW